MADRAGYEIGDRVSVSPKRDPDQWADGTVTGEVNGWITVTLDGAFQNDAEGNRALDYVTFRPESDFSDEWVQRLGTSA